MVASLSPDSKDLEGFRSIFVSDYFNNLKTAVTLSSSSSVRASGWLKVVDFPAGCVLLEKLSRAIN